MRGAAAWVGGEGRGASSFQGEPCCSSSSTRARSSFLGRRHDFGHARRHGPRSSSWRLVPVARLPMPALPAPQFQPGKLRVQYEEGSGWRAPPPHEGRWYTLTHNDLTGELVLSIGRGVNREQISGWYTRLVRDEVLAQWRSGSDGLSQLHVFCHVSGDARWLAPPALRDYIFRREMALVLDAFRYADRLLLSFHEGLRDAPVYVHLLSDRDDLNRVVPWGRLDRPSTWPEQPQTFCAGPVSGMLSAQDRSTLREARRPAVALDDATDSVLAGSTGLPVVEGEAVAAAAVVVPDVGASKGSGAVSIGGGAGVKGRRSGRRLGQGPIAVGMRQARHRG